MHTLTQYQQQRSLICKNCSCPHSSHLRSVRLQSSAKHRNCRAQNRLRQLAEQMLMCLRAPEGCLCACFKPWPPNWVPKPQSSLCWTLHQKHGGVEAHGCIWFADPTAQQSYLTSQFHYSFTATALCPSGLVRKGDKETVCHYHSSSHTQGCTCPHAPIQYVQ